MQINIKTIPHKEQRYPTVGDWWFDRHGILQIRVSQMNGRYEFLVAIHEAIEAVLCNRRRIREVDVTAFDVAFEAHRVAGNTDEPGDAPDAPYRKEHFFATSIERLLAAELQIDWADYTRVVDSL